jgi:hypothetical protein
MYLHRVTWLCILCLLGFLSGCAGRFSTGWDAIPGTVDQQRNRAALFDPFPDDTVGPAMMNRPWGYQNPRTESRRILYSPYSQNALIKRNTFQAPVGPIIQAPGFPGN